ncbi:MFS transporter [uncultured Microbacterium sp.]|uniref:MFS transporter n=1 Tax=uncultured Microbacterium sp. TaxID=191216 RepID=UPI0035CA49EE
MSAPEAVRTSRAALFACLAAGFATLLDATVVAYTAPSVSQSLGATTAGVQWFLASYSLTFGLGLVPAGRLGDAFGRRGLFVGGMVTFLLGAVASAFAPSIALLVAGRLLQGLGAGVISAQVLGVIQDIFHGSARVRAFGAYTAAGALAAIIGPLLAGLLLWLAPVELGWRLVLLSSAPFAIVAIWLGVRSLPNEPHGAGSTGRSTGRTAGLDLPGIALLGAIVVMVTLPVIDPGMPLPAILAVVGGSAILIAALVGWERAYARRGRLPLFAPQLLRSHGFVTGNVVALLWFGSLVAFSTVTTVYFLQGHGIPALVIAAAFVPGSLARMVASRSSSKFFDRFGPRIVALGLGVEMVCLLLVIGFTFVWEGWGLFVAAAILQIALGFTGGMIEPPLRAITLGFAPPTLHGVAASFLQLTQRLSATFFVALATGVILGAGGALSLEGLRIAVGICVVAVAGAIVAATRRSLRRPAPVLPAISVDAPA